MKSFFKRYKKHLLIGLGLFLIIAQFFKIDKTNPPVDQSKDFITIEGPDTKISDRLLSTCYDCHSHTTKYPWYTDVAPVSWWVKRHINLGRNKLNFSVWGDYSEEKRSHKLEECVEYTTKKWMPLGSYTWMHAGTKMNKEERAELVTFFEKLK